MGVLCNSRCDQRHVYASRGTCYSVLHSGVGGMIAVDMDSRQYGERLDRVLTTAIRECGLTWDALAHRIGTTRQRMARWRVGESAPTILELYALSDELGLDISFLTEPPAIEVTPTEQAIVEAIRRGVADGSR